MKTTYVVRDKDGKVLLNTTDKAEFDKFLQEKAKENKFATYNDGEQTFNYTI